MSHAVRLAPSLLAADFSCLGTEVRRLDDAGCDMIHLDIMDGHFVPNISFGPALTKSLRPYTKKPFDVHLMVRPVDPFIDDFVAAGADMITIHQESGPHLHRSIQRIKAQGLKVGVALNPATAPHTLDPILEDLDLVLVMSVNPGFGGQSFIESSLCKIEQLAKRIDQTGLAIDLEVDGGINPKTAPQAINAGANLLVAGTATFQGGPAHYADNIQMLKGAR